MKKLLFIVIVLSFKLGWAQDTLVDPQNNIISFSTWDMGFYMHSPNTNNTQFGEYSLPQGIYNSTVHSAFYIHRNIMLNQEALFKTKTGLLINSLHTYLSNQNGEDFYYSQSDIDLAFLLGVRFPMEYNSSQDKFFKAVDLNFGLYTGTPMLEYFANAENKYNGKSDYFAFNYIKFGMIAEVEYSLINKNGYGHRIGLRTMVDFNSIWKFKNNETGIYPSFVSLGIYYNFWTSYIEYRD